MFGVSPVPGTARHNRFAVDGNWLVGTSERVVRSAHHRASIRVRPVRRSALRAALIPHGALDRAFSVPIMGQSVCAAVGLRRSFIPPRRPRALRAVGSGKNTLRPGSRHAGCPRSVSVKLEPAACIDRFMAALFRPCGPSGCAALPGGARPLSAGQRDRQVTACPQLQRFHASLIVGSGLRANRRRRRRSSQVASCPSPACGR